MFGLASALFAATAGQLAAGETVTLHADVLTQEANRHLVVARGHVRLQAGTLTLHTGELRYDQTSGRFEADGPIFGVDRSTLLTAQSGSGGVLAAPDAGATGHASAVADAGDPGLSGVRLAQVRLEQYRWLPPNLAHFETAAEARAAAQGAVLLMVVEAKTLLQTGNGSYRLEGVRLSPCSCADEARCTPDWALFAGSADVQAGDHALLDFPALRLGGLPIPILRPPALYFPLGERRSGLLLPHVNWQVQNGFLLDEPYFQTLGPSADLTLSAGLVAGQSEQGNGANGVAGPRLGMELRYAPAPGTTGRLWVSLLDDRHHDPAPDGTLQPRGVRGLLRFTQLQDLGADDGDRFDLNLVTDARLTGQLTTDLLFAQVQGERSVAFAFHRAGDWLFTVDAVYLQDFQGRFDAGNFHDLLFGNGAPRTLARLPALSAALPEVALGRTPFRFGFESSLLRSGAVGAAYDNLAYGLNPASSAAAVRPALEQLDLLPRLSLPYQLGTAIAGSLAATLRQDLWAFEEAPLLAGGQRSELAAARSYPIFDFSARSEIWRDFGSDRRRLRHTVEAGLDLRAIPWQLQMGTLPLLWFTAPPGLPIQDRSSGLTLGQTELLAYDEIALASGITSPRTPTQAGALSPSTAPGGLAQGRLFVDQRLRASGGELARLEIGENFDGAGPEATYAQAAVTAGPLRLQGFASFAASPLPCPACTGVDRSLRRLSEAWAEASLADGRGDSLGLSFVRALAAGAPRLSAPLDLLFAPRLDPADPRWGLPDISQANGAMTVQLGHGFSTHGGLAYQLPASAFSQVVAGLGYRSPQRCCTIDLSGIFQPSHAGGGLGFAALALLLDLGELAGSASH